MRLNINEEISGHKKEFLDFEKALYTIARQRGLTVQREKKQADNDTGYMYIAFADDGFEVAEFDIWYDFKYDYDYPDRDWFVTVKWYDESLDDGVRRTDYATFDEAKRYIDSILKDCHSYIYGESISKKQIKEDYSAPDGMTLGELNRIQLVGKVGIFDDTSYDPIVPFGYLDDILKEYPELNDAVAYAVGVYKGTTLAIHVEG